MIIVLTPIYLAVLGLKIYSTIVRAQKIDGCFFKTFDIVISSFKVLDKLVKTCFFYEICLLANINLKVIFGMTFFIFSNANIQFAAKKFT